MASAIVTPAILSSLRCVPHLPHHTWFFLTSATLSSLNLPSEIPHVLHFALENGGGRVDNRPEREEQLQICRKTREALIKLVPISGLPKAINALNALKSATPSNLLDDPLGYSPTGRITEVYDIPSSAILNRGHSFWSIVYGKISRRVMGNLDRSGTEDLGLMARLMYGYILSNTSVLSAKDTSYVLLAGLIPQDVNEQTKGHLQGARNHGSTIEEVKAVREVVIRICEASGMKNLDENSVGGWGWKTAVANL